MSSVLHFSSTFQTRFLSNFACFSAVPSVLVGGVTQNLMLEGSETMVSTHLAVAASLVHLPLNLIIRIQRDAH
jgi:hypothetical protein